MNTLLRILVWLLRIVVFTGLFGLAIKNSGPVELRFFLDQAWTAPISLVVLAVFAVGVAVGLTAALSLFLRPRRNPDHRADPHDGN
jgi:uncharacterized integral membrane protein